MKRSVWKGYYISPSLYKKTILKKEYVKEIWSRKSTILESFIGKYFFIYNGKNFHKVYITREKVGYKFGDFAQTRKFNKKTKKNTANKKK